MSTAYGRGIAETWVSAAITEEHITSADTYYEWLRDQGLYVPRAEVRQVWREHGEATRYADVLERYDPQYPIPRAWYAESESEYISRYGARVGIIEEDPLTGESEKKSYFFLSDRAIKPQDIEDWTSSLSPDTSPPIFGTITSSRIEAIYHRSGASW